MSITVSNWKQICDAPTNRSPSKMTYSFSKANRFGNEKENKYSSWNSDRKCSIISKQRFQRGPPVSAMATSTISPKSSLVVI